MVMDAKVKLMTEDLAEHEKSLLVCGACIPVCTFAQGMLVSFCCHNIIMGHPLFSWSFQKLQCLVLTWQCCYAGCLSPVAAK